MLFSGVLDLLVDYNQVNQKDLIQTPKTTKIDTVNKLRRPRGRSLYRRFNTKMRKANNKVDFEFLISGIWLDIMRMGHSSDEDNIADVKWWSQHKKEINFA